MNQVASKSTILKCDRDYSTLPPLLTMQDGTLVTTPEQFDLRRKEILSLFETHVYGTLPKTGFSTQFELMHEVKSPDGKAIRKQIRIRVETAKGSSDALMLLVLPLSALPVPVILGLNFNGNHTTSKDGSVLPSLSSKESLQQIAQLRGSKSYRWPFDQSVQRGIGLATICCHDFAPDDANTYNTRLISLFDDPNFMSVSAWAFGLSRAIDYLVQDKAVDPMRIALIGHSRLGKAALWAAAHDARTAVVFSNDSGNTGASLSRASAGETIKDITSRFPHWFSSSYATYAGRENDLPLDQHLLLASIAPRKVYVASAQEDLWADPQGAWNSLQFCRPAFRLFGLPILPDADTQPPIGIPLTCPSMGYHLRAGQHDILPQDWAYYLDFMQRYLP